MGAGGWQEGRGLDVSGRLARSGVYFPARFTDAAGDADGRPDCGGAEQEGKQAANWYPRRWGATSSA